MALKSPIGTPIRTPISISPTDVSRLLLPEGYKIERVKTKAERVAELQTELQRLQASKPPDDTELIELGKTMHPYYMDIERINFELKELK